MVVFDKPIQDKIGVTSFAKENWPKVENIAVGDLKKPQCPIHSSRHRKSCESMVHLGSESKVMFDLKPNTQMTVQASRTSPYFPNVNFILILSVLCYFLIALKNLGNQINELKYDVLSLKDSSSRSFDNINAMKRKMMKLNDQLFNLQLDTQRMLNNVGEFLPGDETNESNQHKAQTNTIPSTINTAVFAKRLNLPKINSKPGMHSPELVNTPQKLTLFANILKEGKVTKNKIENVSDKSKSQADVVVSEHVDEATTVPNVNPVLPEKKESMLCPSSSKTGRTKRSMGSVRGNVDSGRLGERQNVPKNSNNRKRKERKGLIAPWLLDERVSDPFSLTRYVLREGNGSVQVTEDGLYFIYAQVYYITNKTLNSFTINLRSAEKESDPIASCSTSAYLRTALDLSEISCFTATVRFLNANEVIFLRQREFGRHLIMKEGHTFLGLVRLQSSKPKPRPQ